MISGLHTLDFETEGIRKRPDYPPKPCGLAIRYSSGKKRYMSWAHASENNCTKTEARKELKRICTSYPVLFHNAAFDIEVGREHMGMKVPDEFHDTLFLAFINNPREKTLSLKPMADKYLNMPPDEQERLRDWILENVPGAHEKKGGKHPELFWAALINLAPGKLAGKYAIGDVERTHRLFKYLYPTVQNNMGLEAYDRERALLPGTLKMERGGVRVSVNKLKRDIPKWRKERDETEKNIQKRLGKTFDIGSNVQLADAMEEAGVVEEWIETAKGNRSTKRENLSKVCTDKKLLDMLSYRGVLETYISTFGLPWLERAQKADGYLYPGFHQVRSSDEYKGGGKGTRSGRFSSSDPNFQNVPRDPHDERKPWTLNLPVIRSYVIPDDGCVLLRRDYSQQELRILAHFEDGKLMHMYNSDPWLDLHTVAKEEIKNRTGIDFPREFIKQTAFGIIYGMGLKSLAERLGITKNEARSLKTAYLKALPGIKGVMDKLEEMAADDVPLRTWGGRFYYCEEPKMIQGRMRSFEYKMLNYLIQPSAADCTKQGMINLDRLWSGNSPARITIQVHDELLANAPRGHEKKYMREMTEAMEDVAFDVPMLTEGKMGRRNWADMKPFEALPKERANAS